MTDAVSWLLLGLFVTFLALLVKWSIEGSKREPLAVYPDPFHAEVLHKGVVVADLSGRERAGMFWSDYQIEARDSESARIIGDDALWERCEFEFRDPATGRLCTTAFVGGQRPFVRDGKVLLRGLDFEKVT